MQEKNWSEVTRLPEEDLALVSSADSPRGLDQRKFAVLTVMSLAILLLYLLVNYCFYPAYPVVTPRAEQNTAFAEHYPPFRMSEWTNYVTTEDVIAGKLFSAQSLSCGCPAGFPLVSAPLTLIWGKAGPYFTNAFLLWLSALLFFFVLIEIVSFPTAVGATLFLAFATPNLFYAASAFAEPLGQVLALLALFFTLRGTAVRRGWLWHLGAGIATGLTLFVQPSLAFMAVPFLIFLVLDGSGKAWEDRNTLALTGGFVPVFVTYALLGKLAAGTFFPFIFGAPGVPPGTGPGLLAGIWRIFAGSPYGLIPLVPALILVPPGLIALWRGGHALLSVTTGATVAAVILVAASGTVPVSESLGIRQIVPVLPFLILPLAYLWEEGGGERIWLGVFAALSLSVGVSGLWGGQGGIAGELQDRDARAVILFRKGLLDNRKDVPAKDRVARFTRALRERNMERWLGTLSPQSRGEILGIERGVFESLSRRSRSRTGELGSFIAAVDSSGILLVLPRLAAEDAPEAEEPADKAEEHQPTTTDKRR